MLRTVLVSLLAVSATTARPLPATAWVATKGAWGPSPTSSIIQRELAALAVRGGAEVATKPAEAAKTEAKPEAKKDEAKPVAKKEDAKPEAKTEAKKDEAKPAAKKEEAKPAPKTEAKPEAKKDEAKPAAKKEEAKPAPKPEAKKEEAKPAPKTEAKPEAKKDEAKPVAKKEDAKPEAKKEEAKPAPKTEAKKEEAKPAPMPAAPKLFARIAAAEAGVGLGEVGEDMVGIKRVQRLEAQFEISEAGSLFNRLAAIEATVEKNFGRIAAAESRMGLGKADDGKAMMTKRMQTLEQQLEITATGSLKARLTAIEATVEKKLGRIAAAESRMGLGKPDDNLVMMKRAERLEEHFEITPAGSFKSRMTVIEAVIESHGF